ncbi:TlpA family protein disulfide reductase [Chitinophaga rhizosphaerae]|uniref:TlpA family protein disulfide reductase n=1 Tax=Chitinophaga rhizosphaerae TaxID=1864947 RepID=UPI000F81333A|nr:redoxin domain-containing protein [Chitinophaga rhizosphaerae]
MRPCKIASTLLPILQLVLSTNCWAQNKLKYKLNEKIPDLTFRYVHDAGLRKISDFKGKILVLDFWSRGCGSCIASFPNIESLVDDRRNDIAVVAVMRENRHIFDSLKGKSQILKESNLNFVVGDTIMRSNFPHTYVPYCVWIDKDGRFIGTTTKVTNELLDQALSGGFLGAFESNQNPTVRTELDFIKERQKLIRKTHEGIEYYVTLRTDTTVHKSFINKYIPLKDSASDQNIGFLLPAFPLSSLLPLFYTTTDHVLLTSTDERLSKLIKTQKATYNEDNPLVYMELVLEPGKASDIAVLNSIARTEIGNFFGITYKLANEPYPSLVLKRTRITHNSPQIIKIEKIAGERKLGDPIEFTKNGIKTGSTGNTVNQIITGVIGKINFELNNNYHVINETNQNLDNIIVTGYLICKDLGDIDQLNKMLGDLGYTFSIENRILPTIQLNKTAYSHDSR